MTLWMRLWWFQWLRAFPASSNLRRRVVQNNTKHVQKTVHVHTICVIFFDATMVNMFEDYPCLANCPKQHEHVMFASVVGLAWLHQHRCLAGDTSSCWGRVASFTWQKLQKFGRSRREQQIIQHIWPNLANIFALSSSHRLICCEDRHPICRMLKYQNIHLFSSRRHGVLPATVDGLVLVVQGSCEFWIGCPTSWIGTGICGFWVRPEQIWIEAWNSFFRRKRLNRRERLSPNMFHFLGGWSILKWQWPIWLFILFKVFKWLVKPSAAALLWNSKILENELSVRWLGHNWSFR